MNKSVKYIMPIILILILCIGIFIFFNNKSNDKSDVGVLSISNYEKLEGTIWTGEVNFREMYFAFQPKDYKYKTRDKECMIFEKVDGQYLNDSFYAPKMDVSGLELKYLSGEMNYLFKGEYKDGDLIINGVKLKKIKSIDYPVYGNGVKYPTTKS